MYEDAPRSINNPDDTRIGTVGRPWPGVELRLAVDGEILKRWTVLDQEWLPGGPERTPTSELKRKPIAERYAAEIDALYA